MGMDIDAGKPGPVDALQGRGATIGVDARGALQGATVREPQAVERKR